MTETIVCHRCPGVVMEDDGEWYQCPCCRTSTRGRKREQARFEARAAEKGMKPEEYRKHLEEQHAVTTAPPPAEELKRIQEFAKRMKEEWVPVCEHDTNPWT